MSDYVYGRNSFFEALANGRIIKAYVLDDSRIKDAGISYKIVDRHKLDNMCKGKNHQGYVAEVKDFELSKVSDMIKDKDVDQIIRWAMKEANPLYPTPVLWGYDDLKTFIDSVRE